MTDYRNMLLTSDKPIDQIIKPYVGSISVTSSGAFPSYPHTLAYRPLYYVKWSLTSDFKTSYEETGLGTELPGTGISFSAQTSADTLYLFIGNNGAARTVYFRVILFMPPDVNVIGIQSQALFDNFIFNTDLNYSKVLLYAKTASNNQTITHGLGYYPMVDVWKIRASDGRCIRHVENDAVTPPAYERAEITTTSLILSDSAAYLSYWYYKIYVDEV